MFLARGGHNIGVEITRSQGVPLFEGSLAQGLRRAEERVQHNGMTAESIEVRAPARD